MEAGDAGDAILLQNRFLKQFGDADESGDRDDQIKINADNCIAPIPEQSENAKLPSKPDAKSFCEIFSSTKAVDQESLVKLGDIPDIINQEHVKVFIPRDYSVGRYIKFKKTFPKALEGRIDREIFESTIHGLNSYFAEPETISCTTCAEGCLACLTAHLIYVFKQTPYEKCLKKVSQYIAEQNETEYEPKGLKITDPSLRGLRVLEITSKEKPSTD